jgi:hypothetical protein
VLRITPNYADVSFNLALLLQRTNERTNMPKQQITGAAISPTIANRNGLRERGDQWKFCDMQINLIASA